jgi:hypothetical protein
MDSGQKTIKIAVDLDGTISEYPEFFSFFTKAMAQAGCKIYVITTEFPEQNSRLPKNSSPIISNTTY